MSAREELIQRLANDDYSHDTFAESERAAAKALDAYRDEVAHELAEKIRDETWPHERPESENRLIHKLADLIDPEVRDD